MIRALGWLGVRTEHFDELLRFYQDVLDLAPTEVTEDFALLELPNGDRIEIFGPGGANAHFSDAPVAGFVVDDLPAAQALLRARGVEVLHAGEDPEAGVAWAHFRAPDGNLYELTQRR